MIQERYRSDYLGEFVILKTNLVDGKKVQDREWIPNPIENQHISSRAAVVLGPIKSNWYSEKSLEKHRGGHLGKIKLQTYGNEQSWKNLRLDFAFLNDIRELDKIIEQKYQEKSAVYSTSANCIKRPGEFFLLPYNPKIPSVAGILYLAAFDGHGEIFVCGLDSIFSDGQLTEKILNTTVEIFKSYKNTQFYFVLNNTKAMPACWRECRNVKIMEHKKFVSYCDL